MILRCAIGLLVFVVLGLASRSLRAVVSQSRERAAGAALTLDAAIAGSETPLPSGAAQELEDGLVAQAASPDEHDPATVTAPAPDSIAPAPAGFVRFHARVVDAESGEPLVGARVLRESTVLAETDVDGRFVLEIAATSSFPVAIESSGHGLAFVFVDERLPKGAAEHSFALARAASLRGRVLDAQGRSCANVRVVLDTPAAELELGKLIRQRDRIHPSNPRWEMRSDAAGEVLLQGLPCDAPLSVSLWEPGVELTEVNSPRVVQPGPATEEVLPLGCLMHAPVPLRLAAKELRAVEWRLEESLQRLTSATAAGPRAQGTLAETEGRTASQGTAAREPESAAATRPVAFRESEASLEGLGDALQRGRSLAGRLCDETHEPVAGVVIALQPSAQAAGAPHATSASDGSFQLGPLPSGEHELVVYGGPRFGTVSFGPFASGLVDLELVLDGGSQIAGSVLDASTGAGLRASLAVYSATALASRMATSQAGADGRFCVDSLRPGSYSLVASTSDGRIAVASRLVLAAAASVRNLELVPAPAARLVISSQSGKSAKRAVVLYEGGAVAALDLHRRVEERVLVPSGVLLVRLYQGATLAAERSVEVAPGAEELVRFD